MFVLKINTMTSMANGHLQKKKETKKLDIISGS